MATNDPNKKAAARIKAAQARVAKNRATRRPQNGKSAQPPRRKPLG